LKILGKYDEVSMFGDMDLRLGLDEICHMLMEFVSTNWILDWKYSYEVD
jgi:hypothetical protein